MFSATSRKRSVGIACAIIGLALYVIGYGFLDKSSIWYDIVLNIADVLIIGIVVGYLSSVAQWSGVFKKEIQDIVFGKQLLGERKDIEALWGNVTKQLLKSKFSEIHKDLLCSIMETLPNENSISYYEDYDADIKVNWYDKKNNLIEVTEALSFTIVADSDKEFDYKANTWTTIKVDDRNARDIISKPIIKVDGKEVKAAITDKATNGCIGKEAKITLRGKRSYNITYECTKRYDLCQDFIIGLKSQFIIRNLTVSLSLPDGINAIFIENGTNRDFYTVKNDENYIKKRLKGVIFSKQGYIFALSKTV